MFIQSQEACPHKIKGIWNVFHNNWICDDTQINVNIFELTEKMEKEWQEKLKLSRFSIIEVQIQFTIT